MPEENNSAAEAGAGAYSHAMLREIYEQPCAIRDTLARSFNGDIIFPLLPEHVAGWLGNVEKLIIVASGSSRHVGLVGELLIEQLAGLAIDIEYASEYCNRSVDVDTRAVVLAITQSGESSDTIDALRAARGRGQRALAICNVPDSTAAHEANAVLYTAAGPEIAIPATKSVMAQLVMLYLLGLFFARRRGRMSLPVMHSRISQMAGLAPLVERNLAYWDKAALECAQTCQRVRAFLFLGRDVHYPIAREGALKLKECSYVNAEGLPVGELRHGSSALIDDDLAIVCIATHDPESPDSMLRYEKTLRVLDHVKELGGRVVAVATEGDQEITRYAEGVVYVPREDELLLPFLELPPLQLFAYHFALLAGCDVDRPRNLVKAVISQ